MRQLKKLNYKIGRRIAFLREEKHMTQENLAEVLGTSIKHCSSVERGLACFSLEKLIQICELFDVTMDYLVRGWQESDVKNVPPMCIEMFTNSNEHERNLLNEYLLMFNKIKNGSDSF